MNARLALFAVCVAMFSPAAAATTERELVAAVIILEAGGEGQRGMQAVAEVIHTRSRERRTTKREVVTQPFQFSCLNSRTPAQAVARARAHPQWSTALRLALLKSATLTRGANHYCTRTVKPSWAAGQRPVAIIGGHVFFKL